MLYTDHRKNTALYTGVTNDLLRRFTNIKMTSLKIHETVPGTQIGIYEETNNITTAIEREKQIKNWTPTRK
jgi:predicted GIY-YIG superfamily endonuclease